MEGIKTIADLFTEEDALDAIQAANQRNGTPIGMTTEQMAEILGCSRSKIRKNLREYAKKGLLKRQNYSIRSPLDGKLYPTPHYVVAQENTK